MRKISKSKFKPKALEYMREVEKTGESLIISDHGRSTLELRTYSDQSIDPMSLLKGSVVEYLQPMEPVSGNDWKMA